MNRPLVALAGLIVAGGTVGGAVLIVSSGGEEEVVQLQGTATPAATVPTDSPTPPASATPSEDLPPPAEGYTWHFVRLSSFGLVDYAVQAPSDWVLLSEGNPEVIGPATSTRAGPKLIAHVTPPGAYSGEAFRSELPQSGTACEVQPAPRVAGAVYSWDTYNFTCGVDSLALVGRAADSRLGEFFISVLVFQPEESAQGDAAFGQAMDSFTLVE